MKASRLLVSATVGMGVSAAVLLALTGTGMTGCGCSAIGLPSLIVTVTDGPGGPQICDATVTARDGSYSYVLMASPQGPDCTYDGPIERAGTYSIDVVSGTRSKTIDNIQVRADGCHGHVTTQHPTVALDP